MQFLFSCVNIYTERIVLLKDIKN